MDSGFPNINNWDFKINRLDFKEYYRDANEEYPKSMRKPSGKFVKTTTFVYGSFGQNKKNRKPHSGYIIFVNRDPIFCYNKQQKKVETSTSKKQIALKTCVEAIEGLKFKLQMFGILFRSKTDKENEPTCVY